MLEVGEKCIILERGSNERLRSYILHLCILGRVGEHVSITRKIKVCPPYLLAAFCTNKILVQSRYPWPHKFPLDAAIRINREGCRAARRAGCYERGGVMLK